MTKKTITIEVPEGAEVLVNGKPYPAKEKGWWRPESDEIYYYVIGNGEVDSNFDTKHSVDDRIHAARNMFRTREDAQLSADFHRANVEALAWVPEERYWSLTPMGNVNYFDTCNDDLTEKFPTEDEAKAYADLRKRYCDMIRTYVE